MDHDQCRRENVERIVYFRKRDGRGTATYGRGYKSDTDATNARDECFLTTPDATMVWIVKEGCSSTLGAILTR